MVPAVKSLEGKRRTRRRELQKVVTTAAQKLDLAVRQLLELRRLPLLLPLLEGARGARRRVKGGSARSVDNVSEFRQYTD